MLLSSIVSFPEVASASKVKAFIAPISATQQFAGVLPSLETSRKSCRGSSLSKKRTQKLRQARSTVIEVAKRYPAYSGPRVRKNGCTLRPYGTGRLQIEFGVDVPIVQQLGPEDVFY
ncbi:hypothetical protein GCM10010401_20720 [Rarobacter faecitabidus]|uniref:Uncharacterized protein n=1 Tax=Rarobacter faecitabidus TaxID=13243 RepID=A0A542ZV87_RARFA|nr:hypothetical protein FB461_0775 [Rarobacter faecitabidus]